MYHVIIIEDDPMVASINRQYVEASANFTVDKVFKHGGDALEYLKSRSVDLIILDYYTPLLTGAQFIDRLHGMGMAPSIIMVTSANDADIVRSLLDRGVLDYLVKPFAYSRFQAALNRFTEMRRSLDGSHSALNQEAVDQILAHPDPQAKGGNNLAKGLNEATLTMIREFLHAHSDGLYTSEQIAEQVGLSRITIRRYMNYMVETKEIFSMIDYKTGGRPSIKYSLTPQKQG